MALKRTRPLDLSLEPPQRLRGALNRYIQSSLARISYTLPLYSHTGCVNALSLSSSGKWLASGGDDLRILLWNSLAGFTPATRAQIAFEGHRGNIFALSFTSNDETLLSGGADEVIYVHDLASGKPEAIRTYVDHQATVRRVSPSTSNPALFITASEDGCLKQFDLRVPNAVASIGDAAIDWNDVLQHPRSDNLFAAADSLGRNYLLDGRSAWGKGEVQDVAVVEYATTVSRPVKDWVPGAQFDLVDDDEEMGIPFRECNPDTSSLAFDSTGQLLCATVSRYLPTLFELQSPIPLATFDVPIVDSGRGYSNLCTVKNGSFGGDIDSGLFYAAGSDDACAYVWSVPSVQSMRDQRIKIDLEQAATNGWPRDIHDEFLVSHVTKTFDSYFPLSITTPTSTLSQHRSIVNTALFHPTLPLLFTAGVAKTVHVHSAVPFTPPIRTPASFAADPSPDFYITNEKNFVRRTPRVESTSYVFTEADYARVMAPDYDSTFPQPLVQEPGETEEEWNEREMIQEDEICLSMFDEFLADERPLWEDGELGSDENDWQEIDSSDEDYGTRPVRQRYFAGGPNEDTEEGRGGQTGMTGIEDWMGGETGGQFTLDFSPPPESSSEPESRVLGQ